MSDRENITAVEPVENKGMTAVGHFIEMWGNCTTALKPWVSKTKICQSSFFRTTIPAPHHCCFWHAGHVNSVPSANRITTFVPGGELMALTTVIQCTSNVSKETSARGMFFVQLSCGVSSLHHTGKDQGSLGQSQLFCSRSLSGVWFCSTLGQLTPPTTFLAPQSHD